MSELKNKLEKLRKDFKAKLTMELKNRIEFSKTPMEDHESYVNELIEYCHKIAGSAGTFGLPKTSQKMKELELELREAKSAARAEQIAAKLENILNGLN